MMEKKMHSYCEMLVDIAQSRNLSEEVRGMIGAIQSPDVARLLLLADEEKSILDANSDFCMRATLAIRELLKLGLIVRMPEGAMVPHTFLVAAVTIHALFDTIRLHAEQLNMNGEHVIAQLINNPKIVESLTSVRRLMLPCM